MKSKPIHVSYVTVSLGIGGAETQLVRLINGLDRDRFKPSVVCLSDETGLEGALAGDVEVVKPSGAHNAPPGGTGRIAAGRLALSMLAGELRRQRPDVVHAYLAAAYVPAGLAAWWQ